MRTTEKFERKVKNKLTGPKEKCLDQDNYVRPFDDESSLSLSSTIGEKTKINSKSKLKLWGMSFLENAKVTKPQWIIVHNYLFQGQGYQLRHGHRSSRKVEGKNVWVIADLVGKYSKLERRVYAPNLSQYRRYTNRGLLANRSKLRRIIRRGYSPKAYTEQTPHKSGQALA